MIDAGVNLGTRTAIKMLQRVLGLKASGKTGPETVSKFKSTPPAWKVCANFMAARLEAYAAIMKKTPSQVKWAGGWLNRCAEMLEIYVNAVVVDATVESKLLQAAHFARQESLRIQGSPTARKDSAKIFAGVAQKLKAIN